MYNAIQIEQKRVKLLKSVALKGVIADIISQADSAIKEISPAFKMSDYLLFYKTGNRLKFETGYFERRNKCFCILTAFWLTQDEKYLEPLIDYITYICDEFTWCLPAHCDFLKKSSEEAIETVDLFQSETARLFSEIVIFTGDKLPMYVLDRMKYEINRRIFSSFRKGATYFWEERRMNWATVCGAGCFLAALCFADEEEKATFAKRFQLCLDKYLEGIGDDGCCIEGNTYWNYGFFNFVVLADALRQYSNGNIDYFKKAKVHTTALFPQKIRISASKVASFSDALEDAGCSVGLLSFLKSMYSDVKLPGIEDSKKPGRMNSLLEIFWIEETDYDDIIEYTTNIFDDAQWYVRTNENYGFAAKGGYNQEPHNHNDIGSFMIAFSDEVVLSDLGRGEYSEGTFNPEKRYTFLQNSSRGHSVPIINGEYQQFGKAFCAKNVKSTQNTFELDIEGAYSEGIIEKINRKFVLMEDKVILQDIFKPSPETKTIKERFISKIAPELCLGYVDLKYAKIFYDEKKYVASVGTETYIDRDGHTVITVYLIDFTSKNKNETEFLFEISM